MRNAIVGVALAGALAWAASGASIAGIAGWKVLLAGLGLAVFILGGRADKRRT